MLSLMSMSDAFFARIFHVRREFVPFGTVSLTTYFHTDADDLAAEDTSRGARGRRRQDLHQELRRPARRTVVAERPPARDHDPDRVFQGVGNIPAQLLFDRFDLLKAAHNARTRLKIPRIALLGIPLEIGASQRGTLMGPDALRTAGIGRVLGQLGFAVEDHGNLAIAAVAPAEGPAAGPCEILRRDQELDSRAQRTRLWARALGRHSALPRRRPRHLDGDDLRRRPPLRRARPRSRRALARRPRRLQHPRDLALGQHARHVRGVLMRRARPGRPARRPAPRLNSHRPARPVRYPVNRSA